MECLVDVDWIARMLVEYLRVDLADRASFPGGQFADQTWDMLKKKMSSQPNEAKLIEAVETDPRAMHSNLVKSLELWAYQDQQVAYPLADLLYLGAPTGWSTLVDPWRLAPAPDGTGILAGFAQRDTLYHIAEGREMECTATDGDEPGGQAARGYNSVRPSSASSIRRPASSDAPEAPWREGNEPTTDATRKTNPYEQRVSDLPGHRPDRERRPRRRRRATQETGGRGTGPPPVSRPSPPEPMPDLIAISSLQEKPKKSHNLEE